MYGTCPQVCAKVKYVHKEKFYTNTFSKIGQAQATWMKQNIAFRGWSKPLAAARTTPSINPTAAFEPVAERFTQHMKLS